MKSLILVRHAKSSHTLGVSTDFERPLNDRGFREAAEMGSKLFQSNIQIDLFISSPALRAKTTAELFVAQYNGKQKDIVLIPDLYNAGQNDFLHAVGGFDDTCNNVALFSHNPGITDFAASLTNTKIDHMPTCSVFAVSCDIDSWTGFAMAAKKFLFFYKPV